MLHELKVRKKTGGDPEAGPAPMALNINEVASRGLAFDENTILNGRRN
jgi:hypothetical protein